MSARPTVFTRNEQNKVTLTPALRALVKRAVKAALEYEGIEFSPEVSVTFTDNEKIRELNLLHRNIDRPTDVLSFPLLYEEELSAAENGTPLGDIVISLEKAQAQAAEYRHSLERETAFLTVHSVLHLLGYDHEISENDEADMFARQDEILKIMGITR